MTQGRAWERYAWLKARPITGARHDELAALVTPFVFRKYLDFDAYEGLRDVHRQIREQGARSDALANVKLGDGGIREIEFITQALQIVRGGREPDLRMRGTLPALAALDARGLLPASSRTRCATPTCSCATSSIACSTATTSRRTSCRTMREERAWLAEAMDASEPEFDRALARHRSVVSFTFAQTFGDSDTGRRPAATRVRRAMGRSGPDRRESEALARGGLRRSRRARRHACRACASRRAISSFPATSRQRFDTLMPQLLAAAAAHPGLSGAQTVFERLLALLETVARRSAYLALVIEHPPLLPRLANLMSASAWAADYLTRYPLLLDELLDARVLLAEPDWSAWRSELARLLAQRPDDAEHQMDVLRHFRHAHTFRLLAQDLSGLLTVERLADHLSALADVVLDGALAACWTQLMGRDARAAAVRDHRLRQARRQGTGLRLRSRSRVPVRRRAGRCRRPRARVRLHAARAAAQHVAHQHDLRRARCTTPTCACGPTAPRVSWRRACAASSATSASRRGSGSTRR